MGLQIFNILTIKKSNKISLNIETYSDRTDTHKNQSLPGFVSSVV